MTLDTVRKVNSFFNLASRVDVDSLLSKVFFSDRQSTIFNMFYIKKNDIGFIADTLYVSESVVKRELKTIRNKLVTFI